MTRAGAARLAAAPHAVIKRWILSTGNRFIKDPPRRFVPPSGNWGGDVDFVRRNFDDRSWRRVDLPHDWAIEGPFITTGPAGGMGRLPSLGVSWYRKKLSVPARTPASRSSWTSTARYPTRPSG